MNITQVAVGNVLYPLAAGQPLPIGVGQTLRVFYSFNYKVAETTSVEVWASLYAGLPEGRVETAQNKQTITLDRSLDWKPYEGEIDILVSQGTAPGAYGLVVEVHGYPEAKAYIPDCIQVTGFDWTGMIGMALMLGMMGMVVMGMKEAW